MLTPRQTQVLTFIEETIAKSGIAPTVREICRAMDLKSHGSMHVTLKRLEALGVLTIIYGKARGIRSTKMVANIEFQRGYRLGYADGLRDKGERQR